MRTKAGTSPPCTPYARVGTNTHPPHIHLPPSPTSHHSDNIQVPPTRKRVAFFSVADGQTNASQLSGLSAQWGSENVWGRVINVIDDDPGSRWPHPTLRRLGESINRFRNWIQAQQPHALLLLQCTQFVVAITRGMVAKTANKFSVTLSRTGHLHSCKSKHTHTQTHRHNQLEHLSQNARTNFNKSRPPTHWEK